MRLHVTLDLGDGAELIRRFPVGETLLQFTLPGGIGTEGMALPRLAFDLEF